MLEEVDKPGSSIEEYVAQLERLMAQKMSSITYMQHKISDFKACLAKERVVSTKLEQMKASGGDGGVDGMETEELDYNN